MGTIHQPKPSEPKGIQPDQQPLQPGGPANSRSTAENPQRPNIQTPESQQEKKGERRS
ncbi:MAG TPA: hypothetical protein VF618_06970 [Thermoanaerobaculia bacterium]